MGATSISGPLSIVGQKPNIGPGPSVFTGGQALAQDPNPEFGPSLVFGGWGLRDPRYLPRIGAGANVAGGYPNQDCGWLFSKGGIIGVDQAPSLLSTTNLAANQAAAAGVGLTLVIVGGSGITLVPAGGLTVLPTGNVIPAGSLIIDGTPAWNGAGVRPGFSFFDPTVGIARAVAVTAAGGATGGAVLVRGWDIYGVAMSESIVSVAGTTVNGKKAFKFLQSAVPAFTDAGHVYGIGTADVFGFATRIDEFALADIFWNNAKITSATGVVVADATSPATATTGDVRGTYATQTASDSVKKLTMFIGQSAQNTIASTFQNYLNGLLGVPQF